MDGQTHTHTQTQTQFQYFISNDDVESDAISW